jgi:hypothetical protein
MILQPCNQLQNNTAKAEINAKRCYYLIKNRVIITPWWFY